MKEEARTKVTSTEPRRTEIGTNQNLDIVDVYVDHRQTNAFRPVLPYLLNSDEWQIMKCVQVSTYVKHYRFRRLTAKSQLPVVDPLNPKKTR